MNILFIAHWYPNKQSPENGVFIREQVLALRRFHHVSVMVPKHTRDQYFLGEGEKDFYAIPSSAMPIVGWLQYFFRAWRIIRRVHHDEPLTVLHGHVTFPSGFAAVVFGKMFGIPTVVTEHFGPFRNLVRNPIVRLVALWTLQHANGVIAVSTSLQKQILDIFNIKTVITIIPNVVDTSKFYPAEQQDPSEIHIAFIGALTPQNAVKNLPLLLHSLQVVLQDSSLKKKVVLDILGGGPLAPHYEQQARALGIAAHCVFHGAVPHANIPDLLRQYSFLVLPSSSETFGVALIEALACGIPVVATRCGGPEDIVDVHNGILVDADSEKSLTAGILTMLANRASYERRTIAEDTKKKYSGEHIAKRIESLYATL